MPYLADIVAASRSGYFIISGCQVQSASQAGLSLDDSSYVWVTAGKAVVGGNVVTVAGQAVYISPSWGVARRDLIVITSTGAAAALVGSSPTAFPGFTGTTPVGSVAVGSSTLPISQSMISNLGQQTGTIAASFPQVTGGVPYPIPYVTSGTWATSIGFIPASNLNVLDQHLYVCPIPLGSATSFTQIAVQVQATGGAGSTLRLGVYQDDGALGPTNGPVVLDAGTVALDATTGTKQIAITLALGAGLWWAACLAHVTSGTPAILAINPAGVSPFGTPTFSNGPGGSAFAGGIANGPLPTTGTGALTYITAGPYLGLLAA